MQSEKKEVQEKNIKEEKKPNIKEQRIRKITQLYYSRPDIQKAIFEFSKNREVVPRYFEGFGKRPDSLQYPGDVFQLVKKRATSFHCSEELWRDPLELSTDLNESELNNLRVGWDLLIDIDSKYLDYSKIATQVIISLLRFHGIKNIGVKFSGSKGFHIIVPWKAFPEKLGDGTKTSDRFPEWPRIISLYLTEMIKPKLIDKITQFTNKSRYIKDFEVPKKVMPDIILVSPRHLFRMPYSLHEKTALASIVIDENQILEFQPNKADPLKIKVRNFYPEAKKNEAKELLIQALDWYRENHKEEFRKQRKVLNRKFEEIKIDKSKIIYPPAISKILKGLEDGRKRALFILLNYFRCLNFDLENIEKIIYDWNKKNKPPLKEGYVKSQISWSKRQKKVLPPNYDKDYYKGIGIIPTEEEMRMKNPVSFTIKNTQILKRRINYK